MRPNPASPTPTAVPSASRSRPPLAATLCAVATGLALLATAAAQPPPAGEAVTRDPVAAPVAAPGGGLVAVNGTQLWVERVGSGEPLVVVHGGPLLDHGYLQAPLAPLAERYELIFYDQRLSGRSDAGSDDVSASLAEFVTDIEALRQALGLGPIHLLAHSWGARLALEYAIEHGANLRSLLLIDPMAASSELWQLEQLAVAAEVTDKVIAKRRAITSSDAFTAGDPAAIERLLRLSFSIQFADPAGADRLELYVPADYMERSRRFGALRPALESFDLHPALAGVPTPTLLLYGADEPGATTGGPALAAALPATELVVLPEAGHFPFVEQPQAFHDAIRKFLDGVGEAAVSATP